MHLEHADACTRMWWWRSCSLRERGVVRARDSACVVCVFCLCCVCVRACVHTLQVVVDETALETGQLSEVGIRNLQAVQELAAHQVGPLPTERLEGRGGTGGEARGGERRGGRGGERRGGERKEQERRGGRGEGRGAGRQGPQLVAHQKHTHTHTHTHTDGAPPGPI